MTRIFCHCIKGKYTDSSIISSSETYYRFIFVKSMIFFNST